MQPQVIEEEQRLGALDDEIVDVHGHAVDADGVADAHFDGELDLRSHAVRAGHEDRIAVVALEELLVVVEAEHAGEGAVLPQDAGAVGAAEHAADEAHQPVAGLDIHTRLGVGQTTIGVGSAGHGKSVAMVRRPRRRVADR